MAGLFSISNGIATAEREFMGNQEAIINEVNSLMEGVSQNQLIIFHLGFTILPFVLFLISFLVIRFKYKISEEEHIKMVQEIERRKKENSNKQY